MTKENPKKVEITIEKVNYECGAIYSVGFITSRYGSGSPCWNDEEVKSSVEGCIKWIKEEGDIPIIKDLRAKQQTLF